MKDGMNWDNLAKAMVLVLGAGVVSCGALSRSARAVGGKLKDMNEESGELQSHQHAIDEESTPSRGLRALSGGNVVARVGQLTTREEDIVWAPEDPDMPIAELEGLVVDDENPLDSWFEDYGKAMKKARVEGKPVMIWFTRTKNSPLCKVLSAELFNNKEFEDWADENVIRLRVDSNIQERDTAKRKDRERYVAGLKERYRALGQPVVVIISPRGTEFGKYRGYTPGSAVFYFGRLKNDAGVAQKDHASWQSEMASKGYRSWRDVRGRAVFAKAVRYRDGVIWLVEPDGKKSSTSVSKLSTEDRQYVERKLADYRAKKP
ncbi:MAG: thioredoxin fold domain-containing protein [Akkermansiaceae bacterium]